MQEEQSSFTKDFLRVAFSNGVGLISSLFAGFVLPLILGVNEFGNYKIFTLYLTYTALLHFGFIDGLLLKNAGKKYSELNKEKFRAFTKYFIAFQLLVSIVLTAIATSLIKENAHYIFLISIDSVILNVTTYFQYISQSIMRFKELSIRKIVVSILKIILTLCLMFLSKYGIINNIEAWMYIIGVIIIDATLLLYYALTYRDIIVGKTASLSSIKKEAASYFKTGFIITISFQISHLIFALDRQFVSMLFPITTYGIYAFAYNIISMITTVISAVSIVLFPRLKKMPKERVVKTFNPASFYILLFSFGSLILYYPISIVIESFLPKYIDSIQYFTIIFPGLALNCCLSMIIVSYYKALNLQKEYFRIGCIVLIASALFNTIAFLLFKDPSAISAASIIIMIAWYLLCVIKLKKRYQINIVKNLCYILVLMTSFYCLYLLLPNKLIASVLYLIIYTSISKTLYNKEIHKIGTIIKKKLHNTHN